MRKCEPAKLRTQQKKNRSIKERKDSRKRSPWEIRPCRYAVRNIELRKGTKYNENKESKRIREKMTVIEVNQEELRDP